MATKTDEPVIPATEEWEDIKIGLGDEWDLEIDGALTGVLIGMDTIEVEDKQNGGTRDTNAYQFETDNADNPLRFIWGSYNIDLAMKEVNAGDKIRISFTGRRTFTGDRGPQTVKSYRVQRAVRH
jgi:hypothetical protein